MLVVGLGPFRVGSVVWQPRADAWRLTVVCKGTFVLAPGESRLAETQEELVTHDEHWNDDATRSLTAASDMSPFKMRADVLLVGQAFAPRAEPVRSLVARMIVAEMDKAVEVFGNRNLLPDGTTSEPTPFVRMPLRYERAAGGPDTINPVGIPPAALDPSAAVPLPNLEPTGARSARISADGRRSIEPVGLGPVAPSWPLRRSQLGRYASSWSADGWHRSVLPDDIELGYFNAAPRDQQVEAIRDGERFVLENLHPEHAQLVTRLPGIRPRAFVERGGRPPEELPLRGDTLWFDTDRGICCLTWRGQLSLEARDEPGRVLVAMEEARQRITFQEVVALVDAGADSYSGVKTRVGGTNVDHAAAHRQAVSIEAPDTVMTMIHADGPPSSSEQPSTEPADPETHDRPISARTDDLNLPTLDVTFSRAASAAAHDRALPFAPPSGVRAASSFAPVEADPTIAEGSEPVPSSAPMWLVGRSPIAASVTLPAGTPGIELLVADVAVASRVMADYRALRASAEPELSDPRTIVHVVLSAGRVIEGAELAVAAEHGLADSFDPTLVLTRGTLTLDFDDVERLRALAAAIAAFAPARPESAAIRDQLALGDELEAARAWLDRHAMDGAGVLARVVHDRLREAYLRAESTNGAGVAASTRLDTQVARVLLERRAFCVRTILGVRSVRAELHVTGDPTPFPAYLPASDAVRLPLRARMAVRMLADVHPQQDETDPRSACLCIRALARERQA